MNKKTIGIIGGMGPLATVDLFRKIVENTKANTDQEHNKILIDNNTNIPDRTEAIVNDGKSPVPQLTKSAVTLWAMGAEILVMPCNTAHYFLSEVQKNVEIPILNMIEITGEHLLKNGIKTVGLLATKGTINSKIYQDVLLKMGINIIEPNKEEQSVITDLIYHGVKAGNYDYDVTKVNEVMASMVERGAETLILGCTELPVAMNMYHIDFKVCDPTLELAREAIKKANGECK
ncbi:MAG: amino acid racemase [Clostridia bacterium]|nr:amino acid racemase [Clostridia bacterium]